VPDGDTDAHPDGRADADTAANSHTRRNNTAADTDAGTLATERQKNKRPPQEYLRGPLPYVAASPC
jgi:hypothetical protein